MAINIYRDRAWIWLEISPEIGYLILTTRVKEITAINNNLVKIDIGDPLRNVYIRTTDLSGAPQSANSLAGLLNSYIRDCLCYQEPNLL